MAGRRPIDTHSVPAATKAKIFSVFMQYDTDRDGYVTYDEAHEVLKHELGYPKQKSFMLCKMCDKNGDGKLSYEEFITFFFKVQDKSRELESIFNEFDTNKDGFISIDEARTAMTNLGFSRDEIDCLIVTYDVNGDGRLQYEEFVQLWNAQ